MEGILIYDERDQGETEYDFCKRRIPRQQSQIPGSHVEALQRRYPPIRDPKPTFIKKFRFDTYDLKLELAKAFTAIGKRLKDKEMSIDEIKEKMEQMKKRGEDTTSLEVEAPQTIRHSLRLHHLRPDRSPPGYSTPSFGKILRFHLQHSHHIGLLHLPHRFRDSCVRHTIPAFLAGWAPNFLFGGLGIYLLVKAAKESPFKPSVWLNEAIDRHPTEVERALEDV